MQAKVLYLESNNHLSWEEFENYTPVDPFDAYGWFHVTVGAGETDGGNDFQICVATPKAVGPAQHAGSVSGLIIGRFDAGTIKAALTEKISSIQGHTWEEIVDQLRTFMHWEYEGM